MSAWIHAAVGVAALVLGGILATLYASLRDFSRLGARELAAERGGGRSGPGSHGLSAIPERTRARSCFRVLCHLTVVVATVLGVGSLSGGAGQEWLVAAGGILLAGVLVWLFGTVVPISIATHAAEAAIYRWAGFVRGVQVLMSPAAALTRLIDEIVRRVIGKGPVDAAEAIESEILEAVEEGEREGQIDEGEREMIEAVVEFRSRTVEQIMTPRTEVAALDYSDDLRVVLRRVREIGHSRVPVFTGSLDHVDGCCTRRTFCTT